MGIAGPFKNFRRPISYKWYSKPGIWLVGRNQKPSSSIFRDNAAGGVQLSALLCISPMANIRTCQINAQLKRKKEKTGTKTGKAKIEHWQVDKEVKAGL